MVTVVEIAAQRQRRAVSALASACQAELRLFPGAVERCLHDWNRLEGWEQSLISGFLRSALPQFRMVRAIAAERTVRRA